jgi:BirA family transcriptional regulator, biotin operon repressor / biotin---[acetyl-CoA-carboxylase] ligase
LVELGSSDPSAPTLSLAAGLALIEAVDAAVPDQRLMLKWPNDLLLGGRKLAGILLERSGDRIVAGFGVNLASAPLPTAASLGGAVTPQVFAPLLAASFARLLALWRSSEGEAMARAWLARAHPAGTPLTVHSGPGQTVSGSFAGIEPDGALRLRLPDGSEQVIRAGDVEL